LDIIENNPDKPWNWEGISKNPNITLDIIQNNINKSWDLCEINYNRSFVNNLLDINDELAKHFNENRAAKLIQKVFKDCYYNPNHIICKKRLLREFNNLIS